MSAEIEQSPVLSSETSLKLSRQKFTPLFEQLINTIELIDSIDEKEPEPLNDDNSRNENGSLNIDFTSSLSDLKQRLLGRLPVLIWQRKNQQEKVTTPEKPEIQTAIGTRTEGDGRRHVSFFQLSNTLQVSYPELRKILAKLGIEYMFDKKSNAAAAFINMDDILRLRDHIITQKNIQQDSASLKQNLISLSEASRRLNTSVGTVVDAIERQQLPLIEYPGGQRYISADLLDQVGKFTEQQDALERLIRFSQSERTRSGQEQKDTSSSNGQKGKDEEKVEETDVKLIEFALQNDLPVDKVLDVTRSMGWKFGEQIDDVILTPWHQGILKTYFGKDHPKKSIKIKAPMPEGALSTNELANYLGINYQTLIRLKLLGGITPLRGRMAKYYAKEDIEKIANKLNLIKSKKKVSGKTTLQITVENLPDGAITFRDFLEQLEISDATLRKLCKKKNITPLKNGRTAYFDIDQQATITALVEDSRLSHAGRPHPARKTDEAWERYEKNLRIRMQERRRQIRESLLMNNEEHQPRTSKPKEESLEAGTQFTIIHPKLGTVTFTIVPADQVDARKGKLSSNSPIVSALQKNGHKPGDKITIKAPQGEYEVELVSLVKDAVEIVTEED
ncbi:MAG: GreA/GreB family elongation factor [Candidatus Levybacteria bacterium]|nr:GreA/GreB family elongation factor [Candidatus Levybacteria bacterium]